MDVSTWHADRHYTNDLLDSNLFHRELRRQFSLPYRERIFSARNSRYGDFDFLRCSHACWRRGAPALFGVLIGTGSRTYVYYGYLLGAALMLIAAGMEMKLGVKAEAQSLESISEPLASAS